MKNHLPTLKILTLASLMFTLTWSCKNAKKTAAPDKVIITGQIINPTGDSAFIRIPEILGNGFTTHGAKLDTAGTFRITFVLEEPSPVTFFDGNETTQMFVNPGDSIHLTLNTEMFDETVNYSGKGAEKNNFLASKYLEFEDNPQYFLWNLIDSVSIEKYKSIIDKKRANLNEMLTGYIKNNPDDTGFIRYEKTNNDFEYAYDIYTGLRRKKDNSTGYDTVNVPETFYKTFESFTRYKNPFPKAENYKLYYSYYYPAFLEIINYDRLKGLKGTERDSVKLQIYIENLKGDRLQYVLSAFFYTNLKHYRIASFEKLKGVFEKYVTNPEYKAFVNSKYKKIKKLLAQNLPKGANLTDLERKEYSGLTFQKILKKYRGKVVYLDFWASWCSPCRGEMPYSLKLQEYFKDRDVAFVYFSSDKDSTAWKQMIKILQITGDHYRVNKHVYKEYNKLYNVRYIPRYVLIDKTGKTVDDKAKRPSNPGTVKDIEKLLE